MSIKKKQTAVQRLKRLEKAVGELYIMIHHLSKKIDEFAEDPKIEKDEL
jgi:hypothetical protein